MSVDSCQHPLEEGDLDTRVFQGAQGNGVRRSANRCSHAANIRSTGTGRGDARSCLPFGRGHDDRHRANMVAVIAVVLDMNMLMTVVMVSDPMTVSRGFKG